MKIDEQKIINLLNKYEIHYLTKGKNISESCIGITCPFCDDHSEHCGIFKSTGRFSCWRCNTTGSFADLLSKLTGLNWRDVEAELESTANFRKSTAQQIESIFHPKEEEVRKKKKVKVKMPKYCYLITKETDSLLLDKFLFRRGIVLQDCIERSFYICTHGDFMHRMIVPIFQKDKFVAYQGIDMTGKASLKVKTSKNSINQFLYDFDYVKDVMVLTEGVLDTMRVGENAVATFGTHITTTQANLIKKKGVDTLIFAWDSDAYWKAKKFAGEFEPFIPTVKIVHFPQGEDPDSYGRKYSRARLHQLVFGKERQCF